jgi:hypothetical protein
MYLETPSVYTLVYLNPDTLAYRQDALIRAFEVLSMYTAIGDAYIPSAPDSCLCEKVHDDVVGIFFPPLKVPLTVK